MKSTLTLMAILRTATQTKDMVRKQVQLDRVVVQLEIVRSQTYYKHWSNGLAGGGCGV